MFEGSAIAIVCHYYMLIITTIIIIIELRSNRERERERCNHVSLSTERSSEEHLSPVGQPIIDHGGLIYVIRYLISHFRLINSTRTYIHPFVYSFPSTPYFLATGTFCRAACSSIPASQNFHTKQTSATSSRRVVHRRLHILTRVAMQNILSLRNHVSRRVATRRLFHRLPRRGFTVYFAYLRDCDTIPRLLPLSSVA